jgi:integrase
MGRIRRLADEIRRYEESAPAAPDGQPAGDDRRGRAAAVAGGIAEAAGIRNAIHDAAFAAGCDFEGLGPHSFRRINITRWQEAGASAIEAAQIAGHSTVRQTYDYTRTQLKRQEDTTRAIQERLVGGERRTTAVTQVAVN